MTDTIRAALERLMPCPFCGSEAGLEDHRLLWVVRCSSCSACVLGDRAPEPEQELPESYWAPFRQSAVDRWNRRPSAPPAPEVGDVSDEELTQFLFERFRGPIEFLCDTEEESHLMIRSHVRFAHAAIALDRSRRAPVPPAEGEVGEVGALVEWLRETGDLIQPSHLAEHQRYKRAAALLEQRHQPPQPVAVSERLPGPEDCDAEGRCWWFTPQPWPCLYLLKLDSCGVEVATHWLPFHALPLPTPETTND